MHVTGMRGMPRRVATYPEGLGWDRLNMLSSIGSYILAAGVALFVYDFFRSRRRGSPAPRDPWGAGTLEWLYPPVTPGFNFHAIPPVLSREPLWDQPELLARPAPETEGVLLGLRDGRRETLGCDPVSGAPLYILRLPHPTFVPLLAAAGLALLFGATLASAYWLCAVGAGIALLAFLLWGWEPSDSGVQRDAGMGLSLPVNPAERRSHTHIGTVGTMLVLMALYASLVFGLLYLWNTQPGAAEALARPMALPAVAAALAGLALAVFGQAARRAALGDRMALAGTMAALTAAAALLAGAALAAALWPVDPWASALGATLWALAGFVALNLGVTALWALVNTARKLARRAGPGQALPDFNLATYAKGTALMVLGSAALCLLGALGGAAP
jgi:cytochrome c oxidase subunit I+III